MALAGAKEVFYFQKTDEKIEFSRQARMIAVCVIANPSSQCYNYIASEKTDTNTGGIENIWN